MQQKTDFPTGQLPDRPIVRRTIHKQSWQSTRKAENLQTVDKLPSGEFMIGAREIAKAAKSGSIEKIFVASNCGCMLFAKFEEAGAEVIRFTGDQNELAARLGKPFPVAVAGLIKVKE